MNPYDPLRIHKEERLAHVSKRLKKTLCKIKKNTLKQSFVQPKISEPKADYIATNYSTVILQHRGKSPADIAGGLNTFLTHASVEHSNCPSDIWCQSRQTSSTAKPPPTRRPTTQQTNSLKFVKCSKPMPRKSFVVT